MSGFTKLHTSLLESTIWGESNTTRILWITMLAMCDQDGTVEASIPGLAARARLSVDETMEGLRILSESDLFSRTKENEGRRIIEIEGGWFLINHAKYRDRLDPEKRRTYLAEKKAESRAKTQIAIVATKTHIVATRDELRNGYVFFVATKDRVKIAFSTNPWARYAETKSADPKAEFLGFEAGVFALQTQRHEQFASSKIGGNWFRRDPSIIAFAATLRGSGGNPSGGTTKQSTTSTHTEAESEAENKDTPKGVSAPGCARSAGIPVPALPVSELAPNPRKTEPVDPAATVPRAKAFPWRQVMGAMKGITPEIPLPNKAGRPSERMKIFWRNNGMAVAAFEALARKVQESDYLMARNGHKGCGDRGQPYSWNWVFADDKDGVSRAEKVMNDLYSTEAMSFVLEKDAWKTEATLTTIVLPAPAGAVDPVEANLSEIMEHEGKPVPRYTPTGVTRAGYPEYIDHK